MQPFETLTEQGRLRRLRKLALRALEHYDLDVAAVRGMDSHSNALFRARTRAGESWVVRVAAPGWRTETDLRSGMLWLEALARDTDIGAPRPLRSREGELVLKVQVPEVPTACWCSVESWIPGVNLGQRLTEANLAKMGELFARLHQHAAGFAPPEGFTQRRMDSIYARDEEDVLFSEAHHAAFDVHSRVVFERVRDRVAEAFAVRYADPDGLRVIHNDLWHDNIKCYRGRLFPVDFEDTLWGYPVQDIAMALQDLMTDGPREAYESLQAAFRQGYASRLPWPERYPGEMDTFRAGRMLWVANYVARYEDEYLREHIEHTTPLFARFLETGELRKVTA